MAVVLRACLASVNHPSTPPTPRPASSQLCRAKLPVEILESLPLLPKGKGVFHMEVGERQEMTGILCGRFENKLVGFPLDSPGQKRGIRRGDYSLNNSSMAVSLS